MGPGPWVLEILVGAIFFEGVVGREARTSLGSNSGSRDIRTGIVVDDILTS